MGGSRCVSTPACCAQVTLLGVSRMLDKCVKGRKQQSRLNPRATYACFDDRHFEPFTVTTQPYEGLSHATLAWLIENQDQCDVLQARCAAWIKLPLRCMVRSVACARLHG